MAEKNNSTVVKTISALCIIIPPLGALGVHDFVVGRKKCGIAHIAMILLPIALSFLAALIIDITVECTGSSCAGLIGPALIMGTIIGYSTISSYIWAIVECSMILMGRITSTYNYTRESKKRTL